MDEGEVAAKVFDMFKRAPAGRPDLRKIVETLNVHPRIVRELYKEYRNSNLKGEHDKNELLERRRINRKRRFREDRELEFSIMNYQNQARKILDPDSDD